MPCAVRVVARGQGKPCPYDVLPDCVLSLNYRRALAMATPPMISTAPARTGRVGSSPMIA